MGGVSEGVEITPNPDDEDGVYIYLPELDYLDTQAWSADIGISLTMLRDVQNAITEYLATVTSPKEAESNE